MVCLDAYCHQLTAHCDLGLVGDFIGVMADLHRGQAMGHYIAKPVATEAASILEAR
jgi:hypothetical protein